MKVRAFTLNTLLLIGLILSCFMSSGFAQADRTLSIETNREAAETRIERLHNDLTRRRLQRQDNQKLRAKGKRPQQYMRF